ncbi:MAG TPA: putative 2OG-Fe(II) oxygenase [Phenylobacterium sp.]|uniref:putative 2OG-Fe(II) oxygenase n=1 Tax=Phenylobacterium sp. TaxID=1871053 RepID=UPI002F946158
MPVELQPAPPPPVSAETAQALEQARQLARSGQASGAERTYRAVLARDRDCVQAAAALARLLTADGRAVEAAALITPFVLQEAIWPEALSARAAALKAAGRKAESLADYQLAARINPTSGVAAHNVASGLGDAGLDQEAAAEAERAFSLGLDAPETWLVYGRALQGLRRFEDAERALRCALARRPIYPDALRDLSQLLWMTTGDPGAALAPLDAALAAVPSGPLASTLAGVKVRALNHIVGEDEALAFAEHALRAAPGDLRLALETAVLSLRSAPERSLELCSQVVAHSPRDASARRALAHALLAVGDNREAARIAETLLGEDRFDQEAAAALATAWRAGGDDRYRQLWDYSRLVYAQAIDTPRGWTSLAAYLEELAAALIELHGLKAHPLDQSLRGGTQTSQNLLVSRQPAIAAFFQAIEGPIRAYRERIGQGEDLFRARNRGGHRVLGAWSVRLRPGGFHVDHLHPQGWISSACYIAVPKAVGAGADRAGWLRFGQPSIPTRPALEAEHFVRPEPGLLALFPSYMWHGTVPFGGDEPRMTIAFDLIPA